MKTVVACIDDIYEDLELWYPVIRMREANIKVEIAGPEAGKTYHAKHGYPCKADRSFKDLDAKSIDGLLIPGGFAPDKMRRDQKLLELVRALHAANKPIAFICHGGWVPISAGILKGKKATGTTAIKDDLENAGAIWKDEPLVIDGNLISSRTPVDLHLFGKAIVESLNPGFV